VVHVPREEVLYFSNFLKKSLNIVSGNNNILIDFFASGLAYTKEINLDT
jgi:hypothetical protein